MPPGKFKLFIEQEGNTLKASRYIMKNVECFIGSLVKRDVTQQGYTMWHEH